jgi:hypothetical protein
MHVSNFDLGASSLLYIVELILFKFRQKGRVRFSKKKCLSANLGFALAVLPGKRIASLELLLECLMLLFSYCNRAIYHCHKRQVLGDATAHCFMPPREEILVSFFSVP